MATHDDHRQSNDQPKEENSAADLIRQKINALYDEEPDAKEEIAEVEKKPDNSLSKHQRYMKELSESGRSLAEIQTAWHEYYTKLSDKEKHQVWQEFYAEHQKTRTGKKTTQSAAPVAPSEKPAEKKVATVKTEGPQPPAAPISHNTAQLRRRPGKHNQSGRRQRKQSAAAPAGAVSDIRDHLLDKVRKRAKVTKNPHVRALAFGLSMGCLTLLIMMFSFFNERIVTPFIRPNANVSATPIIVDPNASADIDDPSSKIIIPKINVEAPVVFDVPTIQEDDIQKGLEKGVVHYVTTPNPGEKGNSVIFGHSSSNILNKGKYKFAFLMLKSLEPGDTFIVQKDRKRYVYKVYNEFVVSPTDFSVLGPTDKPATMTLITCDPPGTSTNRLIIQAEQIFPDPSGNAKSSVQQTEAQQPKELPSNSVTLWQRIKNWF